jgi:DNA helicase-2/ATP-dependent DNA helicase PcrA
MFKIYKNRVPDEAENRLENISELYNAVLQFQEENEDTTLGGFLANASLASDLDDLKDGQTKLYPLMTYMQQRIRVSSSFLVGLEQGLFPNFRSMDDPTALEEERRLCYVGITRAQEQLYLSHARERRLYGNREPAVASQFIGELPKELLCSTLVKVKANWQNQVADIRKPQSSKGSTKHPQTWQVGELLIHDSFGTGEVTHVFGSGNKVSIAVKFPGLGQKILDPKKTTLQRVD